MHSRSAVSVHRARCAAYRLLKPQHILRVAWRRRAGVLGVAPRLDRRRDGEEEQDGVRRLWHHGEQLVVCAQHVVERILARIKPERCAPVRKQLRIRLQRHPRRRHGGRSRRQTGGGVVEAAHRPRAPRTRRAATRDARPLRMPLVRTRPLIGATQVFRMSLASMATRSDATPPPKRARTGGSPQTSSSPPLGTPEDDEFDEFGLVDEDLIQAVQETEAQARKESTKPAAAPKPAATPAAPAPKPAPAAAAAKPAPTKPALSGAVPPFLTPDDPLALERATMDQQWFSRLEPAMKQPSFAQLKSFLDAEKRAGRTIYPPPQLIHSWSRTTPLEQVKVVIVGQDPYHQPGQACGHCFSVPKGKAVPASLQNIYKELANEFPDFRRPTHGCLDGWAHQGVLLLNACLTVNAGQAGSHHNRGWEPFTREILKTIGKAAGGTPAGAPPAGALTAMLNAQAQRAAGAPAASPRASGPHKGVVFLAWGLPAARTLADAGITEVRGSPTWPPLTAENTQRAPAALRTPVAAQRAPRLPGQRPLCQGERVARGPEALRPRRWHQVGCALDAHRVSAMCLRIVLYVPISSSLGPVQLRRRHVQIQVHQAARADVVDPAVQRHTRIHPAAEGRHFFLPVVLDHGVLHDGLQLVAHTRLGHELDHALMHRGVVEPLTLLHLGTHVPSEVRERAQVAAQRGRRRQLKLAALLLEHLLHRGAHAATASVSHDNHMLHAERLHGVGERAHRAVVVWMELVCHVAQHKQLAGPRIAHNALGHTGVAASDPEHLGVLALAQRRCKFRLLRHEILRPRRIPVQ